MRGGVCEDACASVIGLSIQECGLGRGDQVHTHSHAGERVHTEGAWPAQVRGVAASSPPSSRLPPRPWTLLGLVRYSPRAQNARERPKSSLSR